MFEGQSPRSMVKVTRSKTLLMGISMHCLLEEYNGGVRGWVYSKHVLFHLFHILDMNLVYRLAQKKTNRKGGEFFQPIK